MNSDNMDNDKTTDTTETDTNDNVASFASLSSSTKKASPSKNDNTGNGNMEVISLIEKEEKELKEAMKQSSLDFINTNHQTSKRKDGDEKGTSKSKKRQKPNKEPEVIELLSSDDDDGDDGDDGDDCVGVVRGETSETIDLFNISSGSWNNQVKKAENGDVDDDDDDDEVIIVNASEAAAVAAAYSSSFQSMSAVAKSSGVDDGDDDEIMEVGTKGGMDLPHMRQHCIKHTFIELTNTITDHARRKESNTKMCDKCFCYVCDILASECTQWNVHCGASDKGSDSYKWKSERSMKKNVGSSSTFDTNPHDALIRGLYHFHEAYSSDEHEPVLDNWSVSIDPVQRRINASTTGCFEPNEFTEANCGKHIHQCRKCHWWNIKETLVPAKVTAMDWCRACGRVARETDFNKHQSTPYVPRSGDISLGTKHIPFRIKARDPRNIDPFKKKWEEFETEKEEWTYDEMEMKHDFFRHRIGKNPSLQNILSAMPILEESKIPESGTVVFTTNTWRQPSNDYGGLVSGFELEALLIDDESNRKIFEVMRQQTNHLHNIANKHLPLAGIASKIFATYNALDGTGSISITLTIPTALCGMNSNPHKKANHFADLLGVWFSVFPFKLSELTCGLPIENCWTNKKKDNVIRRCTGLRPRKLNPQKVVEMKKYLNDEALDMYKNEAEKIAESLTLISSANNNRTGGIADNDVSFRGVLRRYCRESMADDLNEIEESGQLNDTGIIFGSSQAGEAMGIISTHREMLGPESGRLPIERRLHSSLFYYLQSKDLGVAIDFIHPILKKKSNDLGSINGIMAHLENLHHEPIDHIEGLNVDLFDFQREAVGWANNCERMEGGLQKFLWTKLPTAMEHVTTEKTIPTDIYFSPILDCFKKGKPLDIRGGIIAEQMGLGKTIISLALILKNPAPILPLSGTVVKNYNFQRAGELVWPHDKPTNLSDPTSMANYLCRGTLVVCNVSLVGQWIDEAKSKLKNPGLVYAYHGTNRKRCAQTLANNAIVVTTYATLASDNNYHRKKSKDPSTYCAPCEQIYWWRVICDESHALKDQTTHVFRAMTNIRVVNKWCVTGTPVSTSLNDLRGPLSFLGFDNVPQLFSKFANQMQRHFGKSKRSRRQHSYSLYSDCKHGDFLFLMRNIMIRHAIQMKSRIGGRSIMTLPPKEEKVITTKFAPKEREEYDKIEKIAQEFYRSLKARDPSLISKNYLKISAALIPLRLACSGGQPEEEESEHGNYTMKAPKTANVLDVVRRASELECPICLDHVEDARATNCNPVPHIFCNECIMGCFDQPVPSCPSCRNPIKAKELCRVNLIDPTENESGKKSEVDKINLTEKPKGKKAKKKTIEDLLFKSKFERLVKELTHIRDKEPESKSLVFSQFFSTLQWMQQELPKHGFQFRTLSGNMAMPQRAKALRDFQSDPSTTIFLLSMRSGAVGINLTQANRVFLMEPAFNPALEAQAVGRVYRLGQRKAMEVIRMRIENSVETRMAEMLEKKYSAAKKKPDADDEEKKEEPDCSSRSNGGNSATVTVVPSIGHMSRDKAALVIDEFDALFGV